MDGLVFSLFFLLSGPRVIDMYERIESNDHPQVFLCLLILSLKKLMGRTTTMRSVYPPLFFFFFFSLSKFLLRSSAQGLDLCFPPPNRGAWLVALDLMAVFRLGGAHFQGKLVRSRA